MPKKSTIRTSELRGMVHLLTHATQQVTELTESAHHTFSQPKVLPNTPIHRMIKGISGLVFSGIKHISRFVGHGADQILHLWHPHQDTGISFAKKEEVLAVVNGVVGDYLSANHNPLAIAMHFRYDGEHLPLHKTGIREAYPSPKGKFLLMLHGLCMNDVQWNRKGHNHGEQLAAGLNMSPVYLRYNSGLHISDNGRLLSDLLEKLITEWPVPVEEFTFLTHSMGGLVARSALYYGQREHKTWPDHLKNMLFLGTPHYGAPLEKIGHHVHRLLEVHPYVKPFARIGSARSAGITDLRFGHILEEDWKGRDRFKNHPQENIAIPLPENVHCFAIAACLGKHEHMLNTRLLGDGLVPVDSALGRNRKTNTQLRFKAENSKVFYGMGHLELLQSKTVYQTLNDWLKDK